MNLSRFKTILALHPDNPVRFILPDGDSVPAHYHVTEVGHVTKRFMDCGGTLREISTCQLQIWLGVDETHRMSAGKLAGILESAQSILPSDELEIEVEYEACAISQYPILSAAAGSDAVRVDLIRKHTDCLAKEVCGIEDSGCCS